MGWLTPSLSLRRMPSVMVSPGIETDSPFVRAFGREGVETIGEMELACRFYHDHQVRAEGPPVFLRGGGVQRNVFRPVADGGGGVKHAHPGAMLHGEDVYKRQGPRTAGPLQ